MRNEAPGQLPLPLAQAETEGLARYDRFAREMDPDERLGLLVVVVRSLRGSTGTAAEAVARAVAAAGLEPLRLGRTALARRINETPGRVRGAVALLEDCELLAVQRSEGLRTANGYTIRWPHVLRRATERGLFRDQPTLAHTAKTERGLFRDQPTLAHTAKTEKHGQNGTFHPEAGPARPDSNPALLVPKNTKNKKVSYQGTNEHQGQRSLVLQEPPADGAGGPRPIGEAVAATIAAAVDRVSDPVGQKRRLAARIRGVLRDARCGAWVVGAAADLVVFHGVPVADLEHVLADIEAMRAAGTLRSAGALFHHKAAQLARRRGAPWPAGEGGRR